MKYKVLNMCDTCKHNPATCTGKPKFADELLSLFDLADKKYIGVIACDKYKKEE